KTSRVSCAREKFRFGGCYHLPHETLPDGLFARSLRCAFRSAAVRRQRRRLECRYARSLFGLRRCYRLTRTVITSPNGSEIHPTGSRPTYGFIETTAIP